MFNALVLDKTPDFHVEMREVDDDFLSEGDVVIDLHYSTLNYKDALAITNRSPVVRKWPMVPGIDGAGVVAGSTHPDWRVGDRVVLNGFGVGEVHRGCFATRVRVPGDWLVRLPDAFSPRQAMAIGTAGYTAMLCLMALQQHGVEPAGGEVLVTGATGGVGSVAVALLANAGFEVVASTGKVGEADYLMALGAQRVIDRAELAEPSKPLQKERWAAVIDAVGGTTLANACAQTRYGGAVAACGLAQGADLPTTVLPFILRGVALLGVDSVMAPLPKRQLAWQRLAAELRPELLESITTELTLYEAVSQANALLDGRLRGRIVVTL